MARCRRLSLMEREELSRMLAAGSSLRAAAQALQRAPSTLARELTRHRTSPLTYRAVPAHLPGATLGSPAAQTWDTRRPRALARRRLASARAPLVARTDCARLAAQRYPDDPTMRISHEAIYTYLYVLPSGALKRELARYLRCRHRFRRPHKIRLSSRPIRVFVAFQRAAAGGGGPHGARALGGGLCSWAMPMPRRLGRWSSRPLGLPCWSP